jgi:hypothetical protein
MPTAQDNNDLRATLAISQVEALTGTTRILTLPMGRTVTVTIPPGVFSGQEIRLPGQGMTQPGMPVGTLILTINVVNEEQYGPPQLAPEQANMPTFATPLSPTVAATPFTPYSSSPSAGTENAQPKSTTQPPSLVPPPPPGYPNSLSGTGTPYQPPPYPAPTAPAPQPQPRPRSKTQTILLVVIALIVIVGAIGLYTGVIVPAHNHAMATATAAANQAATAQIQTAQANATGTADAQVSQDLTATVTSNQTGYNQIIQGAPTLSDSMASPDTYNWDTGTGCYYSNGAYYVKSDQKNTFVYCSSPQTNFSNFVMRVQWKLVNGDGAGLIFRATPSNGHLYEYQVESDGSYELNVYTGSSGSNATTLLSGPPNNNFNAGQAHSMAIEANGSTLKIFIDDTYLGTILDNSYSSGQIGLIANDVSNTTLVMYTKVQVWKI